MTYGRSVHCVVCGQPVELPFAGLFCTACAEVEREFHPIAVRVRMGAAFRAGDTVLHMRQFRVLAWLLEVRL